MIIHDQVHPDEKVSELCHWRESTWDCVLTVSNVVCMQFRHAWGHACARLERSSEIWHWGRDFSCVMRVLQDPFLKAHQRHSVS